MSASVERRRRAWPVLVLSLVAFGGRADRSYPQGAGILPPPSSGLAERLPPSPSAAAPLTPPAPDAPPVAAQGLPELGSTDLANALEGVTPTPMWYQAAYWFGPIPWDAGVELGINGSKGINEVFSLRSGGHLRRVTPRWKLDSSLVYNKNVANAVETQNNAKLDARLDRILSESQWTLFNLNNFIYDEFQPYDLQMSINFGVGYQLLKNDFVDLLTRIGTGGTKELGGVDEDWQYTALFGADYTHKISKTQRLSAKVDYFPEWGDWTRYRVVSDLGWVIDLDKPENVSLKLSLIDRYDSTPNGVRPNSFDYAVLLIWGL